MNEGLTLSHLWHVFESFEDQCTARQQSLLLFRNTPLGQVESHKGCYCERAPQWNCCQEQSKTWSGEIRCTSRKVNWSGMHLALGKHRHCRCMKNKLFFIGIIGTSWTGSAYAFPSQFRFVNPPNLFPRMAQNEKWWFARVQIRIWTLK